MSNGGYLSTSTKKPARIALLCAILLWSLGLRIWRLDQPMFKVDEAESTINALTILDAGCPTDHYLGQPIYENTLTQPWPESPEYEFKDSSYSSRGFAIYHGWLPLYSIAGSLKLFGIKPDRPALELSVRYSVEEMARLTLAARAPAVLFGMLFLVLVFAMADELYGRDAAWAALLVAAFSAAVVDLARQARYYALTTLLSTACCLIVWRVYRHGRWRDYVLAAILFALLFHTHVIAFLIAGGAMGMILPLAIRRRGFLPRMLVFAGMVLALTLPWVWLTGFLEQAGRVPRAWPSLRFPDDLLAFLGLRLPISLLLIGGSLALLVADLGAGALPQRYVRPFVSRRGELWFLITWMILTYLGFTLLAPAVSYSLDRMALPMLGPGVVLGASFVAAVTRMCAASAPSWPAGIFLAAYLALFSTLNPLHIEAARPRYKQEAIEFLRRRPLAPNTRLYATPNFHLLLTVYTGLPVQSVAPVRKSFLDSYPGEILLIEVVPFRSPSAEHVQQAAAAAGVALGQGEAQELAWLVTSRAVRERLHGSVAEVDPPLETDLKPAYLRPLIDDQPLYTEARMQKEISVRGYPAMFRSFRIRDWRTWWPVYFYRFVSPEARMGPSANYRERLRNAKASVLPSGATIYQCPALAHVDVPVPQTEASWK